MHQRSTPLPRVDSTPALLGPQRHQCRRDSVVLSSDRSVEQGGAVGERWGGGRRKEKGGRRKEEGGWRREEG
eukprot:3718029-Rhodomonas_salina.1